MGGPQLPPERAALQALFVKCWSTRESSARWEAQTRKLLRESKVENAADVLSDILLSHCTLGSRCSTQLLVYIKHALASNLIDTTTFVLRMRHAQSCEQFLQVVDVLIDSLPHLFFYPSRLPDAEIAPESVSALCTALLHILRILSTEIRKRLPRVDVTGKLAEHNRALRVQLSTGLAKVLDNHKLRLLMQATAATMGDSWREFIGEFHSVFHDTTVVAQRTDFQDTHRVDDIKSLAESLTLHWGSLLEIRDRVFFDKASCHGLTGSFLNLAQRWPGLSIAVDDVVNGTTFRTHEQIATLFDSLRCLYGCTRTTLYQSIWLDIADRYANLLTVTHETSVCKAWLVVKVPLLLQLWQNNMANASPLLDPFFKEQHPHDVISSIEHLKSVPCIAGTPESAGLYDQIVHSCVRLQLISADDRFQVTTPPPLTEEALLGGGRPHCEEDVKIVIRILTTHPSATVVPLIGSLVAEAIQTQYQAQQFLATSVVEILTPSLDSEVLTALVTTLSDSVVLSILHIHNRIPTLMEKLVLLCNHYGNVVDKHLAFAAVFNALIKILEIYQVLDNPSNRHCVEHLITVSDPMPGAEETSHQQPMNVDGGADSQLAPTVPADAAATATATPTPTTEAAAPTTTPTPTTIADNTADATTAAAATTTTTPPEPSPTPVGVRSFAMWLQLYLAGVGGQDEDVSGVTDALLQELFRPGDLAAYLRKLAPFQVLHSVPFIVAQLLYASEQTYITYEVMLTHINRLGGFTLLSYVKPSIVASIYRRSRDSSLCSNVSLRCLLQFLQNFAPAVCTTNPFPLLRLSLEGFSNSLPPPLSQHVDNIGAMHRKQHYSLDYLCECISTPAIEWQSVMVSQLSYWSSSLGYHSLCALILERLLAPLADEAADNASAAFRCAFCVAHPAMGLARATLHSLFADTLPRALERVASVAQAIALASFAVSAIAFVGFQTNVSDHQALFQFVELLEQLLASPAKPPPPLLHFCVLFFSFLVRVRPLVGALTHRMRLAHTLRSIGYEDLGGTLFDLSSDQSVALCLQFLKTVPLARP